MLKKLLPGRFCSDFFKPVLSILLCQVNARYKLPWMLFVLCSTTYVSGESKGSLERNLFQISDTTKVNVLNQLSREYQWKDPEKSKVYARQAYQLASRLDYKKGASYALWKLGTVHEQNGNYNKALEYFLESLSIQPLQENTISKAHALGSISNLYINLKQYDQAQIYLAQSFSIFKKNAHVLGIAISHRRMGFLQLKQNQLKHATQNFFRSLKQMEALQDTVGIGYVRSYLGQVYFKQGKYQQALQEYTQALLLQDKIGNYAEKANLFILIGNIYSQTGQFTNAINNYTEAVALSERLDFKPALQESYKQLTSVYKAQGRLKEAFSYFEKFVSIRDSIFSSEKMENLADLQTKYETFEKEQEITLLKKEREIQELKLNGSTYLMYFFVVILGLLLLVCGLLYSRYLLKKRANSVLQSQNEAIVKQKNKIEEQNTQLKEAKMIIETQNQLLQSDKVELEDKVKEKTTALMDAYTNLLQVNEEMDTLVYKSSHDLRGPLATFMGICNIAFMDIKEELALSYFGMLLKNANRMDKLLYRLLKVNHVKHAQVNSLLVEPEQIVKETLDALKSTDGYDQVSFYIDIGANFYIHSDADLIKTILENLLENSIHYRSSKSGRVPGIWIKIESNSDAMKILIKDNGIGISTAYIPKLFNMFSKGTLRSQGSGLGLHIARAAIQKLQGSIHYCDAITDATVFEVIIPNLVQKPVNNALLVMHKDERNPDFSERT